jgi:hypothetical protein
MFGSGSLPECPWPLLFVGLVAMVRSHHSMRTDHTLDAEHEILKRN